MTTEQQLQAKIEILITNIKDALIETKEMIDLLGEEKQDIKGHNISLNDMFDFSKMDIKGFITYLFLTNQNKKVFGDFDFDLISVLFCGDNPVVSKKIMNALVKSLLK